jgi:hypothetical protein
MLLHINKFIDRLKSAESRALREVTISLSEARDLHADITRLLVIVQDIHEQRQQTMAAGSELEVDGGRF